MTPVHRVTEDQPISIRERIVADTCVKCGGKMEEGFVVDQTYGGVASPEWAGGFPDRSVWTGVKMKGRTRYPVTTYRCDKCGYLEAFARPVKKSSH